MVQDRLEGHQPVFLDDLEAAARRCVFRVDGKHPLEGLFRLHQSALIQEHPAQVEVRELVAAVTLGFGRLLEPRDRLLRAAKVDQVITDVVVGIAEVGVQRENDPGRLRTRSAGYGQSRQ